MDIHHSPQRVRAVVDGVAQDELRSTAVRNLRWSKYGWAGFPLGLILISVMLPVENSQDQTAAAAPPVVRQNTQPFDKDWLEVHWVLRHKCTGCHRSNTDQQDFATYETVMGKAPDLDGPIVIPGQPEESLLWQYVNWNHNFDPLSNAPECPQMPPEEKKDWLTAGQLQTLYRWIKNGALEYVLPDHCNTRPLLETDFVSAKECAQCHPRQYEDWSRSMHAYAQHSPVFEAFTLTMIERTGGTIGTFCTRCHTPIGVSIGETGSTRNVHRARISMEGVTCVVCHRLEKPFYKASGRLPVTPGLVNEGCTYGPFGDPVNPDGSAHEAAGVSHLTKASFCGACHDVTSPQGVRLEEAFSEWQNSPAAKEGISCQDCHMGPIPGVPIKAWERVLGKAAVVPGVDPAMLPDRPISNHSFVGPDYSLLPDTEFPEKLDWMYETDYRDTKNLTPHQKETLTLLRIKNRQQLATARNLRYELLKNAAKISVEHPETARRSGKLKINVDVTSTTAGHNFPTGFTAERQVWVEVRLIDPLGRQVFASGDFDDNFDLRDDHSHAVEAGELQRDRHLLNFQSKFTLLTAQGTERSVIIPVNRDLAPINVIRPSTEPAQSFGRPSVFRISKGSLPPLQTVGQSYPVRLPDCSGQYSLLVRLNYRNLPPALFDKIGISHLKPLLETVIIDEYRCVIDVH